MQLRRHKIGARIIKMRDAACFTRAAAGAVQKSVREKGALFDHVFYIMWVKNNNVRIMLV